MDLCYAADPKRPEYNQILTEAKNLIASGSIDLAYEIDGYSFLMAASHCGSIPLMEALIGAGADPHGAIREARRGQRTDAIAYLEAKLSHKSV